MGGRPDHQAGIYLHILWCKHNPENYWLYIGQSVHLEQRLEYHRNKTHRIKHSSLHYFIWDQGDNINNFEIEENFVFLSIVGKEVDALLLNLLEMWCALTLQTLTLNALREYLPEGAVAPYAGKHLNVALPIHQSHQANAVKDPHQGDMYHSQDPFVQRYYASLRRRFYDLKFSPNAFTREYYYNSFQTRAYSNRNNARLAEIQIGKEAYAYGSCQNNEHHMYSTFCINQFKFSLNRRIVHLQQRITPIQVRCIITEDKSSHPHVIRSKNL